MLLQILPADGSALYTETNLHNLFPEPWNMITSTLFLIPAIYWLIKFKCFDRRHAFLSIAVWLMLTGCIGSTLFHGFRQWRFFMYLDWVPIALLCLLASIYFIIRVTGKWYSGVLSLLAFGGIEYILHELYLAYDKHVMFSINYAVMVLMIVGPLVLLLIKTKWRNGSLVAFSGLFFGFALFFRLIDGWKLLPIGTHFLWHTFGAIATSLIFLYIYRLNTVGYIRSMLIEKGRVLAMYGKVPEKTAS
jgi:hypothetical protein